MIVRMIEAQNSIGKKFFIKPSTPVELTPPVVACMAVKKYQPISALRDCMREYHRNKYLLYRDWNEALAKKHFDYWQSLEQYNFSVQRVAATITRRNAERFRKYLEKAELRKRGIVAG